MARSSKPRYLRLQQHLLRQIRSGELGPGDQLPSERELAEAHDISRLTVRSALEGLTHDGVVRRVHGKGTYVAPRRTSSDSSDLVGLLVYSDGHLWGDQTRRLVSALHAEGFFSMVVTIDELASVATRDAAMQAVLDKPLRGLIVCGVASLAWEVLDQCQDRLDAIVFINQRESARPIQASSVLVDHRKCAYLATRHLLERNYWPVCCVLSPHTALQIAPELSTHGKYLLGYQEALAEADPELVPRCIDLLDYYDDQRAGLRALLTGPDRPRALYVTMDYTAKVAMEVARELGLRIPDDLAIIGQGHTPWCELVDPPLTTVDVCPEEIARLTVRRFLERLNGTRTGVDVFNVTPRLIVRSSCGGVPLPSALDLLSTP